jgi:hypothetical protein
VDAKEEAFRTKLKVVNWSGTDDSTGANGVMGRILISLLRKLVEEREIFNLVKK